MLKKRPQHRCSPVNIATFLKVYTWKSICEQLLLSFCLSRLSFISNLVLIGKRKRDTERGRERQRETERESQREKKLHLIRLGAARFWFGCFLFAQLHCKILIFPSLSRHYNFLFDNLQANHNRWCTAPLRYNNYNGILKANDAI